MRQRHLWLVAVFATSVVVPLRAQDLKTADEVIAKYIEAVGGRAKLDGFKSMRISGKAIVQGGMEMPLTVEMKRPDKVRIDSTFQGMTITQAYDGKTGWMVMPLTGKTDPEKLPEEQVKHLASRADMDGPLVDYQKKGHKAELAGTDELEGTPVYKLKMTKKDGDVDTFFIDKESFLPIGMKTKTSVQGTEVEVEVSFGDYKPVDGVMMAHSVGQKMGAMGGTTMTFDKVETNVDLPDSRFAMPEAKGSSSGETKPEGEKQPEGDKKPAEK